SSSFLLNDTATTEIYTISLHDALPISPDEMEGILLKGFEEAESFTQLQPFLDSGRWVNFNDSSYARAIVISNHTAKQLGLKLEEDRKSTRLNSSHVKISYAVFCLKKKK